LAVGVLGKTDTARISNAFKARGNVDAVAHQVAIALLDHVAQMDADAELDATLRRKTRVALDHAILHLDCAANGIDDASELYEDAVTRPLDALRGLVLIACIATFVAAGGERWKRIAAAFDWQGVVLPANFRVDAWVTPLAYTGKPPIILAGIHPGETARPRSSTGSACRSSDRSAAGVGVVGIRVLAGGALSGSAERHPIASPPPEPIGSAMSYEADVVRASRLLPLVKEGFAASLTEAATRFAISHLAMGTILVGMATPQQFEDACAAVQKGPLPPAGLERLTALQQGFAGEPR
jgi:Domain of unknown function (DUF4175)/Aldo/keto reductase family